MSNGKKYKVAADSCGVFSKGDVFSAEQVTKACPSFKLQKWLERKSVVEADATAKLTYGDDLPVVKPVKK